MVLPLVGRIGLHRSSSGASRLPNRDDLAGPLRLSTVPRPGIKQLPALLEQIAAPIGRLHLVADGVRQRHFGDLAREVRPLGRPIAERSTRKPCAVRSPRPMRRNVISIAMLLIGRPALPPGNTNSPSRIFAHLSRIASAASLTAAPGVPCRPSCARPGSSIAGSARSISAHLRADHFAGARRRQDREFERAGGNALLLAQLIMNAGNLGIGQRRVVLDPARPSIFFGSRFSRWPRHRAGFSPGPIAARRRPIEHQLRCGRAPGSPSRASWSRSARSPS